MIKGMVSTPRVAEAKAVDPLAGFMEMQRNKVFEPASIGLDGLNPLDAQPRRNSGLQGLSPLDGGAGAAVRAGELVLEEKHTVSRIKCMIKIVQEEKQVVVTAMDESKGDFYTATANLHRLYVEQVAPDEQGRAVLYGKLVGKLCFKSGGQDVQLPRHLQKKVGCGGDSSPAAANLLIAPSRTFTHAAVHLYTYKHLHSLTCAHARRTHAPTRRPRSNASS